MPLSLQLSDHVRHLPAPWGSQASLLPSASRSNDALRALLEQHEFAPAYRLQCQQIAELEQQAASSSHQDLAQAHAVAGSLAELCTEWEAAHAHFLQAWKLSGHTNPLWGFLGALRAVQVGHVAEAASLFQQLLPVLADDAFRAEVLNNLGCVQQALGELDVAEDLMRQACQLRATLATEHPDIFQEDYASSLANLGAILQQAEKPEATQTLEEALAATRKLQTASTGQHQEILAARLTALGQSYQFAENEEQACAHWTEALQLYSLCADGNATLFAAERAELLASLAMEHLNCGNLAEVIDCATEAIALLDPLLDAGDVQALDLMVQALWSRSVALDAKDNKQAALDDARRCHQLANDPRFPALEPSLRDAVEGQLNGLQHALTEPQQAQEQKEPGQS